MWSNCIHITKDFFSCLENGKSDKSLQLLTLDPYLKNTYDEYGNIPAEKWETGVEMMTYQEENWRKVWVISSSFFLCIITHSTWMVDWLLSFVMCSNSWNLQPGQYQMPLFLSHFLTFPHIHPCYFILISLSNVLCVSMGRPQSFFYPLVSISGQLIGSAWGCSLQIVCP